MQQRARASSTEDQARSALLWQLNGILRGLGVSTGAFRAVTGRWPVQLSDAELRDWIAWFSAPTEAGAPLPPIPIERAAIGLVDRSGDRVAPYEGRVFPEPSMTRSPRDTRRHGPDRYTRGSIPTPVNAPRERRIEPPAQPLPEEPLPSPEPLSTELAPEELLFVEAIRNGAQVREAAQQAGMSPSTLYQRRSRKPAFAEAWRAALAERNARFEGSDETDPV
ncbi:MAG: hypothetical protein KatS3mg057_2816 [Herpetosiphonaceae bacterium]|nr:MAG: hypothetical protein KatS3mg057_2816 [Herpetosiphonaceae bacterium]